MNKISDFVLKHFSHEIRIPEVAQSGEYGRKLLFALFQQQDPLSYRSEYLKGFSELRPVISEN